MTLHPVGSGSSHPRLGARRLVLLVVALLAAPSALAFHLGAPPSHRSLTGPTTIPARATTAPTNNEGVPLETMLRATGSFIKATAKRAAPPGSTRRSLIKKVAGAAAALPPLLAGAAAQAARAAGSGGAVMDAARPATAAGRAAVGVGAGAAEERAKREVLATTKLWLDTVTSGKPTAAADTAALYAKDGVLWGTVSEQLRVTPSEILGYFNFFAGLPGLRVAAYQPYVRVLGESGTAINDGYYVFAWRGPDGAEVQKRARYSFVYRKNPATGRWDIVDHHSSLLPTAPKGLKPASTVVLRD